MTDAFCHRLRLDTVRSGMRIDLDAGEPERTAIAERLGLLSIGRLDAHAALTCNGAAIHAEGRVLASIEQACVITGDPVVAAIDEPFAIDFLPDPGATQDDQEVELAADDCDVVFHDGATIDLGAAVVDTLALAIDPYPRSAGAEAVLKEVGVMSEEEAGPFGALAALRNKMGENS